MSTIVCQLSAEVLFLIQSQMTGLLLFGSGRRNFETVLSEN